MKIGLLTSNEPRHIYFMSKLSDLFNVEIIIIEPKKKSFSKIRSLVLKKQKKKEIKFFKKLINREKKKIKIINTNKINSKIVLNKLKKKKIRSSSGIWNLYFEEGNFFYSKVIYFKFAHRYFAKL